MKAEDGRQIEKPRKINTNARADFICLFDCFCFFCCWIFRSSAADCFFYFSSRIRFIKL